MKATGLLIGMGLAVTFALGACTQSQPVVMTSGTVPVVETPDEQAVIEATKDTETLPGSGTEAATIHRLDKVRLGPGDHGDALTTGYGIWSGVATEANPVLAPFGDAVPLLVLPVKFGLKKLLVAGGTAPARANVTIESVGAIGTCSNIAVLSGAAFAPAISLGLFCAIIYGDMLTKGYEKDTGRTLDGAPTMVDSDEPQAPDETGSSMI
ncbi:hypothetical protein SAMN04488245_13221 [Alloyangia pacifica]|uniref:Lipoprotein n=2 Tax=Alloyangia pacifica TaxID=311180 RepID=A0A1I6WMF4_9RHOB|nr:hypothetical protein SAMN04488245_13221 [Alloyangia pacifica]SFT27198.1 hypothetical protein SAMN04488050_12821 [Alloyangia pacifica]